MIYVDRSRVPDPTPPGPHWLKTLFQAEGKGVTLSGFDEGPREPPRRIAARWVASIYASSAEMLFRSKCAYCETPPLEDWPGLFSNLTGLGPLAQAHPHRPLDGSIDLDGSYSRGHYSWLTGEWSNVLWVCSDCRIAKGQRFPTRNPRAPVGTTGAELAAEDPLLLDPTDPSVDPEEILIYSPDGRVSSADERGRVTIEILDLNRARLVAARKTVAESCLEALNAFYPFGIPASDADDQIQEMLTPDLPFLALRRQLLLGTVPTGEESAAEASEAAPALGDLLGSVQRARKQAQREETARDNATFQRQVESYSLAAEADSTSYFLRTRAIEKIEIRDFRAIETLDLSLQQTTPDRPHLPEFQGAMAGNLSLPEALGADPPDGGWTIDLPDSPAGESPWLMLLGENGCGKSSVLQAVALTLMGKAYREKLEIDAREFLRRLPGSSGETVGEGVVRVFLTGQREPCELRFSKDSRFFQGSEDPKVLLLAYGATRLLPKNPHRPAEGESFARVENLFDPFVPLQDATAWLLDLHRGQPEVFQEMAAALLDLLGLDAVVELRPVPEKEMILVEIHGTSIPLEKLSDGYQSVLAVTTDIMAVMLDKWSSMVIAEGVVLLDEIGAHLHPRWRMRVVTSLRRAFPKVQFLVSTHDPLCLRGLEDGEVVLMRRDAEQGIHAVRDLPPIKGLTVNQLLTSEHFGLASTLDPALEASFERYSALLADSQRSEEEDRELDTLRRLLGRYDLLGQTRRERLMLEAIDRHLALEPKMLGHVPAEEWDRRLQEELEAILSGVG